MAREAIVDRTDVYLLHARRFVGPLAAPRHNDTEYGRAPTLAGATSQAAAWTNRGFTVWVYDHGRSGLPGASDLRVVAVHAPTEQDLGH